MTAHRTGVLLLITTVICWGLTWPVHKVLLESLPPVWSVALRTAIGMVALFTVALLRGRLPRPARADLPVLLSITFLHMVGFTLLSTWGLQQVTTGRSVVLAYTTPLWVTPGAVLFLGERLTARRVASVALGLLGLAALFNPLAFDWTDRGAVLGNLAILAAAFLWAGSILHIRAHHWRGTPFELLPWEILLATAILTAVGFATTPFPTVDWNPRLVLMLLYAGIPGSALAYWAVAMASRNLPAVTTSLGLLMTPVVSVVTATLWLDETPTLSLFAAIVLILGGVALGAMGSPTVRRDAGGTRAE